MRHVYRAGNSQKNFSLVFLVLSLFFVFSAWKRISTGSNAWLDLSIAIALVLAGAAFAAQTFTAHVVLSDDFILYGSVFRYQSLRLDQIRYRREYEEYVDSPDGGVYVHYLEFVPNDLEAKPLKISKDEFKFDYAFWEWVISVPDYERLVSSESTASNR